MEELTDGEELQLGLGHEKNGLDHAYGEDVHILAEPFTLGMLAELGKPETRQPRFNEILKLFIADLPENDRSRVSPPFDRM